MTRKEKYDLFRKEVLDKDYMKLNDAEFLMWCEFADTLA